MSARQRLQRELAALEAQVAFLCDHLAALNAQDTAMERALRQQDLHEPAQ